MRVGALPKFPSNALNYNLTWSTEGLINEVLRALRKPSSTASVAKCRRWKSWKSLRSTA